MKIRSLILVGGLSSRMNTPKHALLFGPTGHQQSLLQKLLRHHAEFQTGQLNYTQIQITIAVRSQAQELEIQQLCEAYDISSCDLNIVVDGTSDTGPVAGLLAAYNFDSTAHWLVTGCDYPLLETATLHQLWTNHSPKVWTTCFVNDSGFHEPLLAIWAPRALQELQRTASTQREAGRKIGPNSAIRAFQKASEDEDRHSRVVCIQPKNALWIKNVNTPSDWQDALTMTGTSIS